MRKRPLKEGSSYLDIVRKAKTLTKDEKRVATRRYLSNHTKGEDWIYRERDQG